MVKIKVGLALTTGGINDHGINALSLSGASNIQSRAIANIRYLAPTSSTSYEPNIKELIRLKRSLIIGCGYPLSDAITKAAKSNSTVNFAIVDDVPPIEDVPKEANEQPATSVPQNIKPILFNVKEGAFLAGYLAAGYSKTGKVATFGLIDFPPIIDYMDGFFQGVNHYNTTKEKKVTLLGWDGTKGTFVQNELTKALQISKGFEQQGADVIFPILTDPSVSVILQQSIKSKKFLVIGRDKDLYNSYPEYRSVILTSVCKKYNIAVASVIKNAYDKTFNNTPYVGTLANKGVALSSFISSKVLPTLKAEVTKIQQNIINGTMSVK